MKTFTTLLAFLTTSVLSAQTVTGKVYDSISTLENIKIKNLFSKQITVTDTNGTFQIEGKTGDTLQISSLFYNEQKLVLKAYHFHESVVIELKQILNSLDEVQLIAAYKETSADITTVEVTLKNQILEDIKNNPHLYSKQPTTGGIDIIQVIGLIAKLFENKDKYVEPPFIEMTYEDLESLFENSSLFNERFIIHDLQIEKEYIPMFFEFIIKNELDSKLLEKNKEVDLIELFVQKGKVFNKIITDYKNKQ
ncbi:hypothetical protein [Olleya sp. HaHaR_3_96]|uniref:hypothetical protein n=1 Tax=Olleya sp. HaHaR_3_96 TaxID=2745560 RepID=UPI001C4EFFAC|nr:hypothetical protein [Olleya sp. HaHaR_3_96]QXP58294.1 hypothetical protein H0I26_10205 [Olleya sp. HaHaR_3_96]